MHTYTTVSGVRIALVAILVFLSSFSIPQGVITGRVLDDKNEPLNNAVISVYVNGTLKASNETDCDGMYSVKPLEPGSYDIVVVFAGYDSIIAKSVVVGFGNATTLNFQMLKLKHHGVQQSWQGLKGKPVAKIMQGEINGRILDEKKEPMINAAIQVIQNGTLKGGNIADYDGNYVIKPIDPGDYDMQILAIGYDSMNAKSVVVTSGATTTINFQMKRSPFRLQEYRPTCGGGPIVTHNPKLPVQTKVDMLPVAKYNRSIGNDDQTGKHITMQYDRVALTLITQLPIARNPIKTDMDAPTRRVYSRDEISHMPL
jgi:Carboxypeptidase regulatory-like domain